MNTEMILTHPFQDAGLGTAPFRCTGMEEKTMKLPDGTTKASGTCAFCGTGIRYAYHIASSDGRRFVVGCECVRRTDDARLTTQAEILKKRHDKARRLQKQEDARLATLEAQRQRNGGMTDFEMRQRQAADAEAQRLKDAAPVIAALAPLADALEDNRGGFRDEIARKMRNGHLPAGRGIDITCDILARQAGRAGSKAYDEEYFRLEALFASLTPDTEKVD